MAERWSCPNCGCDSNHYNPQYMRNVCDLCGHPVQDAAADQRRQSLDRTLALATDHLRVGNWDACISLVEPLCSQAPADNRLYLILLAATTKGYTDFLLADSQARARANASAYWEKLYSLRTVNGAMQRYAFARRAEIQNLRAKEWYRIAGLLCGVGACLIIAGVASIPLSIFSTLGAIWLLYLAFSKHHSFPPVEDSNSSGNPFIP